MITTGCDCGSVSWIATGGTVALAEWIIYDTDALYFLNISDAWEMQAVTHGQSRYTFIPALTTFDEAKMLCQSHGRGYLVEIDSEEEDYFIRYASNEIRQSVSGLGLRLFIGN